MEIPDDSTDRGHRASRLVAFIVLSAGGCGSSAGEATTYAATLGYPDTTTQLSVNLDAGRQKQCHATLVHAQWALTAAHCFSAVEPESWGALSDFERGFLVRDVEFHPEAQRSGMLRLEQVSSEDEFVAAHDLALVPIDPPILGIAPVASWIPREACTLGTELNVHGEVGRRSSRDRAETAELTLIGRVEASTLLGPSQLGWLLSAEGPHIGPGDSGSGVSAAWAELAPHAPNCEIEPSTLGDDPERRVLVGIVQDANLQQPSLPFGLVPLHNLEHAEWLFSLLEATPPFSPSEAPTLNDMSAPPLSN